MKILKSRQLATSSVDDPLYNELIKLFNQIKLIQGNTELNYTLRNHSDITRYLISKQINKINFFEDTFFDSNGELEKSSLVSFYSSSLQN